MSSAAVQVGGETVGAIGRGLVVLVGVEQGDEPPAALAAAEKLASLRVFDDAAGHAARRRHPFFARRSRSWLSRKSEVRACFAAD